MNHCLSRFLDDESAVSAIEYALLASLIVVVIFASVATVGTEVLRLYNYIKDQVILAVQ